MSAHVPFRPAPVLAGTLAAGWLGCLLGCGGGSEPAPEPEVAVPEAVAAAPPSDSVPVPDPRIRPLTHVETLTESFQRELLRFGSKLAVRDFDGAAEALDPDLEAHALFDASGTETTTGSGAFEARDRRFVPGDMAWTDAAGWMASIARALGPWRRVEECLFHVTHADFASDLSWGRAECHWTLLGETEGGGRAVYEFELVARIERQVGRHWRIVRLLLEHGRERSIGAQLFSDVTTATGLSHEGLRFGAPGNDSDHWNGGASADVDGDGRFDLFVPGSLRNFLYRARPDGTFDEIAAQAGVLEPAGGTGAVFLDFDRDGDQDLVVAHVGWESSSGVHGGATLQLYRGDGRGRFTNASHEVGLRRTHHAFSLTAFDADGDGWTDLFVCGYGRMERQRNNSWIEATNGSPNVLYRNVEGKKFEDVTMAAGLNDRRWSYASAAADADEDGDLDLYVANTFGSNRYYENAGDGTFVDRAEELGIAERGNSMGASFGDLDGDGRLDLFVASHSSGIARRILGRLDGSKRTETLNELYGISDGNGVFLATDEGTFRPGPEDVGLRDAGWVWGSVLADFDLDGRLDVYCANGFLTGDLPEDT